MRKILSIPKIREKDRIVKEFEGIQVDDFGDMTREKLLGMVHEYDGIIAGDIVYYDDEVYEKAKKLKIITRFGVGVDNVDIPAATRHGVMITNVPGVNAESVAEHTVGLVLAAAKNFAFCDREVRKANWCRFDARGIELANKTLGQVGFGNIGSLVAQKLHAAFNMNVLAYDPFVPEYKMNNLVFGKKVELDELIEKSDVITVNVPATEQTKGMFTIKEFRKMKNTVIFVNTGRGEIVVDADLAQALKDREIFSAGLDVLEVEPAQPDNPLFALDQHLILTPHAASLTDEVMERVFRTSVQEQLLCFEGRKPMFLLNDV